MAMCPLCNSFTEIVLSCRKCSALLEDSGKVSDYLDPYGHYNDEDTVKMGDGYIQSTNSQICPHLFVCKHCGYDEVKLIREE